MKRVFWILITPTLLVLMLWGAFQYWVWPRLSVFAQHEITQYTKAETPMIVTVQSAEFKWFWPTLILKDVSLQPQKGLEKILSPLHCAEARIQLDPFQLLLGHLMISALTVDQLKGKVSLDPLLEGESEAKEIPLDKIFAKAALIPIERLFLDRFSLRFESEKMKTQIQLNDSNLGFLLQPKKLQIRTTIKEAQVSSEKMGHATFSIESLLQLSPTNLKILQLETTLNRNKITVTGNLPNVHQIQLHPQVEINFNTSLWLEDLIDQSQNIHQKWKLPALLGQLEATGHLKIDTSQQLAGQFKLNTKNLKVEDFDIGNAQLDGEFKNQSLIVNRIEALHPAGKLVLKNSDLELSREFKFKTEASIEKLDLAKLFESLKLKEVPVAMILKGHLPCSGQLAPFQASCEGWIQARDLHVNEQANMKGTPIVQLDEISAKGKVQVDLHQVSYKADVAVAENTGTSDGVIKYDEGFKINYKTSELNISNVKNLGNLSFLGTAALEGSTEGNSHSAVFGMAIQAKNFVFEKYQLGSLSTNLSYKDGKLFLNNVEGLLSRSTYQGQLEINFRTHDILGQMDFPRTDLSDVAWIFEQVYSFPLNVQGAGQARIRFDGPLNFWKLSYKVDSEFKNGKIGTESFNKFRFNVSALDGNIKTDAVEMQKNSSFLRINGQITSAQKLKLQATGERIKLDESEVINGINSSLFGTLSGHAVLTGSIQDPLLEMDGSVKEAVIDEQEVPESSFNVHVDRKSLQLKSQLFGDRITTDIQWPFQIDTVPLRLKLKTNDWNFSQILSLFDAGFLQNDYQTTLTSDIDLSSDTGEFKKVTGGIKVINLYLKRGPLVMQNEGPMEAKVERGQFRLNNFNLKGQESYLQLKGNDFNLDQLDLQLRASVETRLFHLFLPFLEDLGGPAQATASITGPIEKPQILGSAQLDDAFIKFKGFPHPIERIQAEVLFSHSKVLIQSLKAQLAGGAVTGSGEIQIQGLKDFPTNLKLKAEGVSLNVPDKIRSNGSADLVFSGRWFPFLISGTYNVNTALVEKEFNDENASLGSARQSQYLPKVLKENNFEPLILDLQINLLRTAEVKNSQMDGSVTGQLQVKGPPSNPLLFGKINIEKASKMNFKDKVFEVQSGSLNFNNPNELNPEIYISAQSRLNDYDINLLVQGMAKAPSIRLSSLPPLPEPEIISLLALGVTSSRLEQNVKSKDQATQAGYEIGAAVLSNTPINRALQDKLGLNLQISNSFDSTKNISVPKAIISKKLTKKIEISVSRTLRDTSTQEAKLQYLFNPNLSANVSGEFKEADNGTQQSSESILGLDLVYKREFK